MDSLQFLGNPDTYGLTDVCLQLAALEENFEALSDMFKMQMEYFARLSQTGYYLSKIVQHLETLRANQRDKDIIEEGLKYLKIVDSQERMIIRNNLNSVFRVYVEMCESYNNLNQLDEAIKLSTIALDKLKEFEKNLRGEELKLTV